MSEEDVIKAMFGEALKSGNKIAQQAFDFQDAVHAVAGQLALLTIANPEGVHKIHSTPALAACPLYDRLVMCGFTDENDRPVKLSKSDRDLIEVSVFYVMVASQYYCAIASACEDLFGAQSEKHMAAMRDGQIEFLKRETKIKPAATKLAERMSDLAGLWARKATMMTPGASE